MEILRPTYLPPRHSIRCFCLDHMGRIHMSPFCTRDLSKQPGQTHTRQLEKHVRRGRGVVTTLVIIELGPARESKLITRFIQSYWTAAWRSRAVIRAR